MIKKLCLERLHKVIAQTKCSIPKIYNIKVVFNSNFYFVKKCSKFLRNKSLITEYGIYCSLKAITFAKYKIENKMFDSTDNIYCKI